MNVLLVHGAGEGAYKEDRKLAESLKTSLGPGYEIRYPEMPDEENAPYDLWKAKIDAELAALKGAVVLVGHSIGASVLARCLPEIENQEPIVGIFLLCGPF